MDENTNATTIQRNWRGYNTTRRERKVLTVIRLFRSLNISGFIHMMHDTYNYPDNNMMKFIKSMMREISLSKLLYNCRYVGDNSIWNTDIIYPNIQCSSDKHIKMEVKVMKHLYLLSGDTCAIIIKNGRGEGQHMIDLLRSSVMEQIFILIESTPPFSIAYCLPEDMMFYIRYKGDAKKYSDIELDEEFQVIACAELKAYVKQRDIHYIHRHLIDDNYIYNNIDAFALFVHDWADNYNP